MARNLKGFDGWFRFYWFGRRRTAPHASGEQMRSWPLREYLVDAAATVLAARAGMLKLY